MLKPIAVGLLLAVAAGSYLGCKKDEPPPPLPSAAPAATPTPAAPLVLEPEDAGIVDAAADADAGRTGGGVAAPGLRACCSALSQNAKSAPPPNNQYMEAAALVCNAAASAGQTQGAAMAAIRAALQGAGMPPGCK